MSDSEEAEEVHEFKVAMEDPDKVARVLSKIGSGVTSFRVNKECGWVLIRSALPSDVLLTVLNKTGYECSYVGVKPLGAIVD